MYDFYLLTMNCRLLPVRGITETKEVHQQWGEVWDGTDRSHVGVEYQSAG